MRTALVCLLLALSGPAGAWPTPGRSPARPAGVSPALERTLVRVVRQHDLQLRRGRPAMDLGLVFRMVGRTLERTDGDQLAAQRMALRASRWTAQRGGGPARRPMGAKVVRAVREACDLHRYQVRKGNNVPYLAHLLGVAGIVMRTGGSQNEVAAALLHDAVEDQGGARTMRRIRRRLGREVAGIVGQATEVRGPWLLRKQTKIHRIASGQLDSSGLRVKLADCLHNSSTMTRGARRQGDAFWRVFTGKKAGTLWYYDGMVSALGQATAGQPGLQALQDRLQRQVQRLHRAAGQ